MTDASRTTALLDRIAATLGVPVEAFREGRFGDAETQIACLLADPSVRRLAAAYAALPPHCRSGLVNVAEALVQHVAPAPSRSVEGTR